jgi:hypothetical protein
MSQRVSPDTLTAASIGVVAYVAAAWAHEGLGHAAAAAFMGGHVQRITSYAMFCDCQSLGTTQARWMAAAGILVNGALSLLCLALGRRTAGTPLSGRYFLWLLGAVNGFLATGYLVALSFASVGDIDAIVRGAPNEMVWRALLTALGLALMLTLRRRAARTLNVFIGRDAMRRDRARTLTLLPYVAGSATIVASSLLWDRGNLVAVFSACAATLGGTLPLALMSRRLTTPAIDDEKSSSAPPVLSGRSTAWCVAGGAVLVVLFGVVGRGITF